MKLVAQYKIMITPKKTNKKKTFASYLALAISRDYPDIIEAHEKLQKGNVMSLVNN